MDEVVESLNPLMLAYDKIQIKYVEICCNWQISRNFSSAPVKESNDSHMTQS